MPSIAQSSPSTGASQRPLTPAPRVPAPVTKPSPHGAPPASRRSDSPDADGTSDDLAPKRKRGRGFPDSAPSAALPAVTARDALWRVLTIHQMLSERPRKAPTAKQLAKDIGTSERNIRRDISTMQNTLRLPIEGRRGNGGGYRYTRPHVEFATAVASASELLALAVSAQMVRAYAGTRLEDGVRGALRKLRLDQRAARALDLDDLADVLSFHGTGFDQLTDLDLFQRVTLAALERSELRFSYQSIEDDKPRERTVQPRRIFCWENAWYLRGRDVRHGEIRHYCLGRMEKVRATGRRFSRAVQRKMDDGFGDALSPFGGGKPVRVVLRFSGRAARTVQERRWHHTQRVLVTGPRETEMQLHVPDAPDLHHFVLRWGREAKVLAPASLRQTVLAHARAMLAEG